MKLLETPVWGGVSVMDHRLGAPLVWRPSSYGTYNAYPLFAPLSPDKQIPPSRDYIESYFIEKILEILC